MILAPRQLVGWRWAHDTSGPWPRIPRFSRERLCQPEFLLLQWNPPKRHTTFGLGQLLQFGGARNTGERVSTFKAE